ncbi:hypothetical protein Q7O_004526 [Pectobacterium carotovorum subsp. carotovorum PCCS1]|nr:hypothetical protein [Pectobacterium carotovorum subsp. carotovorum PCCS1]
MQIIGLENTVYLYDEKYVIKKRIKIITAALFPNAPELQ